MAEQPDGTDARAVFIASARSAGWTVEPRAPTSLALGPEVTRRYTRLVPSHLDFLKSVSRCINAKETSWFLCEQDYQTLDSDPVPWRWNEYEIMSLSAASGDAPWQEKIRRFWDRHLPFFLSVEAGDYDYLAFDLSPESFGRVVHGFSPDFEAVSPVAPTFDDFLLELAHVVRGEPPSDESSPLKLLV